MTFNDYDNDVYDDDGHHHRQIDSKANKHYFTLYFKYFPQQQLTTVPRTFVPK